MVDEAEIIERDIVRKGIERLEKQQLQFTKNEIMEEPMDIPLVKKCKTVDVPSVQAAVGYIQKAPCLPLSLPLHTSCP